MGLVATEHRCTHCNTIVHIRMAEAYCTHCNKYIKMDEIKKQSVSTKK